MYKHHEESLKIAIAYLKEESRVKDGLIAIIFGGSVAKGCERPDSDLDFEVIVTDEMYEKLKAEGIATEAILGRCTYPEGYFDIKYYPKSFLYAVADHGSEPARNAWLGDNAFIRRIRKSPDWWKQFRVFKRNCEKTKCSAFMGIWSLTAVISGKWEKTTGFCGPARQRISCGSGCA